jgi:ABC-type phosphate transport system substrate-binding protein
MRILSKLVVGAAVAATAVAMAAPSALADPQPPGTHPAAADVVGVGSDTIEFVFDQFSHDFNATHGHPKLQSWDATAPGTNVGGGNINTKGRGATCHIARPDGSSAGITALETNAGGTINGHPCVDFARSSRGPATGDHKVAFVTLAGDGVTWSTQTVTNAPRSLTPGQLKAIYTCSVKNWSVLGGHRGAIRAILPQASSGTRAFFLKAIGVTSPGPCVISPATLEENEGVNPVLINANVIFPYSIGKFIAEKFHSAKCLNSRCTPVRGAICHPRGSQNLFGCDTHGTMVLHAINRNPPTVGTGVNTKINPRFVPAFLRTLFEVVRLASNSSHIPAYLQSFFGPRGWVCTAAKAKADLLAYGFIVKKSCGSAVAVP